MEHKRIVLLDELRGFAVIGMVAYHFLYTVSAMFGVGIGDGVKNAMNFSQPILAGLFILIAGFTCSFSKNNDKRGLQILLFGIGISFFTLVFIPDQRILFGILHFLGVSILLNSRLKHWLDKVDAVFRLITMPMIFLFTFNLQKGYLYIPFVGRVIIQPYAETWFAPLGLPVSNFYSADYFPMLPWFALFLTGTALGTIAVRRKLPGVCFHAHSKALGWIGKHSLVIYLAHQPLIYLTLWSIFLFVRPT